MQPSAAPLSLTSLPAAAGASWKLRTSRWRPLRMLLFFTMSFPSARCITALRGRVESGSRRRRKGESVGWRRRLRNERRRHDAASKQAAVAGRASRALTPGGRQRVGAQAPRAREHLYTEGGARAASVAGGNSTAGRQRRRRAAVRARHSIARCSDTPEPPVITPRSNAIS